MSEYKIRKLDDDFEILPSYGPRHAGIWVDKDTLELNFNPDGTRRRVLSSVTTPVAAGATLTLTSADSEKTIALDTAAGSIVTLPAATATGAKFRFVVTVTATTNSHIVKVGNATDEFRGYVIQDSDTATAPNTWWAADNDDTITFNRSTTGLAAQGEVIEVEDLVAGHWFVRGYSQASGTEATPFSATVS